MCPDIKQVTGRDRSWLPWIEARVTSRSVIIPTGLPLSVTITLPTSNLTITRNASSTFPFTSTVMMDKRTSVVVAFINSIPPALERSHLLQQVHALIRLCYNYDNEQLVS